jgi:hypothetical protein
MRKGWSRFLQLRLNDAGTDADCVHSSCHILLPAITCWKWKSKRRTLLNAAQAASKEVRLAVCLCPLAPDNKRKCGHRHVACSHSDETIMNGSVLTNAFTITWTKSPLLGQVPGTPLPLALRGQSQLLLFRVAVLPSSIA